MTILLLLTYYLLGVLLHDRTNVLCNDIRMRVGTELYQGFLTGLFGSLLALLCVLVLRGLLLGAERTPKLAYGGLTIALLVVSYQTLFILNTEAVHFVQYAGLAILLFALFRALGPAMLWATILGAADEAYQYWVLYLDRSTWFDFNDVILNMLGAATGCVVIWVVAEPRRMRPVLTAAVARSEAARPVWWIGLIVAAAPLAAYQMGVLVRFPADKKSPWQVVLTRGFPDAHQFWEVTTWGKRLHNCEPMEGFLLSALLLAIYLPIDFRLIRGRRA